jgi:hypothetical protein
VDNPDADFVMRKAVVGYWVQSTVTADPASSNLAMRLVLSSADGAGFGIYSEMQVFFVDPPVGPVLGGATVENGQLAFPHFSLPRAEFSNYMAILASANPAVLECWFQHSGGEGSVNYDITTVRLSCGWNTATPQPGDGRPPRITQRQPSSDAATHDDSGSSCEPTISTPYGVYHLVDEGIGADGWHYCGYEPGYGLLDPGDDLLPLKTKPAQ